MEKRVWMTSRSRRKINSQSRTPLQNKGERKKVPHGQARRRGGSGGSVEPPLKFYSCERTPFEANELTPFKQTNPPPPKKNVLS